MFWVSFGMFSLSEKLHLSGLDSLAAAAIRGAEPTSATLRLSTPIHWRAADDEHWRWFEREDFVDGQWAITGTTVPVHRETGQPKADGGEYLDDSFVPPELRLRHEQMRARKAAKASIAAIDRHPDSECKARHGRPPSKWLRSLHAEEIRIWLDTIEVPQAGVSGMTYWTHLTRDHLFDAARIEGLTVPEQAKLHAAAHYGY